MLQKVGAWVILRAPLVVAAVGCAIATCVADEAGNSSLSVGETNAVELELQLEELKIAFRKVVADNAELKLQVAEREKTVQLLAQDLAVWKSEAQLFQQKWEEAQLAAKSSGAKLMSEGEQRLQKQLAESIRQFHEAQQERDRLRDQAQRLAELFGILLEKNVGLDAPLRRMMESERDATVLALRSLKPETPPTATNNVTGADAEAGKVLDVNKQLQLVVLNVGRAHGVTIGMPFVVLRGDAVVAHVRVVDVREKICGALMDRSQRPASAEVGDRIKLEIDRK